MASYYVFGRVSAVAIKENIILRVYIAIFFSKHFIYII